MALRGIFYRVQFAEFLLLVFAHVAFVHCTRRQLRICLILICFFIIDFCSFLKTAEK